MTYPGRIDREAFGRSNETPPRLKEALVITNMPIVTARDREQMFKIALDDWLGVFDRAEFLGILSSNTQEFASPLIDPRKTGLTLNTAYFAYDKRGSAPDCHVLFISALGRFNDFYGTPERRDYAEQAGQILNQYPELSVHSLPGSEFSLHPISDEIFQQRFTSLLGTIFKMADATDLPVEEFHALRKMVRHMRNIYRLLKELGTDSQEISILTTLESLSRELGWQHDDIIQGVLKPDEKGQVSVPTYLHTNISVIKTTLGIS